MAGQDFLVTVGPEAPDQVFEVDARFPVSVIQTPHQVTVGPAIPDTVHRVLVAQEPTFYFTVSADQADQVFNVQLPQTRRVTVAAPAADYTFPVSLLPEPDKTFDVIAIDAVDQTFEVATIQTPDVTFNVRSFLPPPPAAPEQHTYEVSALENLFRVTTEYTLDIYTLKELYALLEETQGDLTEAEAIEADAQAVYDQEQAEADDALQDYEDAKDAANQIPTVENETTVDAGKEGPDVAEWIAVEISVNLVGLTGNGDDGLGIVQNWDVPIELRFNSNMLLTVSGEKVAGEAQLLELDSIGSLPTDANGSLLATDDGIIDPDLFEEGERFPDQIFYVDTAAPAPDETFPVTVFAAPPDVLYEVTTFAKPADQIFNVEAITKHLVNVAQAPFIVKVFAEPADQVFTVETGAVPPDVTFEVTRGPTPPFRTYEVLAGQTFEVKTSFAIPDRVFFVELGPDPAPIPDFIFNVSVGGPDAPPIPDADQIFNVTTSWAIPNKIFETTVVTKHVVDVYEAPFVVEVGPEVPDQIFEVTSSALPFDQQFSVSVGPEIPTQIFETTIIKEWDVEAYAPRVNYTIQETQLNTGEWDYIVSGNGLSFATEPTINLEVGQQAVFSINTPGNAVWIKEDAVTGPGEVDPFWGDLLNQGTTNGFLYFRPWQAGTYYYQSEFNIEASGAIVVTGTSAAEPYQIFDVLVGADPTGFDELFTVTTGPEFPDQVFIVTAEGGAPPATEYFDVTVGPEIPSKVWEVTAAPAPLSYQVINVGASDYQFNGEGLTNANDPTINVTTGQLVSFVMNAPSHPLWIKNVGETGTGESNPTWASYMFNNGAQFGSISFIINQPGTYYYNCEFHGSMRGEIVVTGAATPQKAYAVNNSGSGDYLFSGEGLVNELDPDLTIGVGEDLFFDIYALGHPLWIKTTPSIGTGEADPIWANVMENNGTEDGRIRVRFNTPGTYFYNCQYHPSMRGTITVTP